MVFSVYYYIGYPISFLYINNNQGEDSMCTLMIDDQPRLIAWTGHQVNQKDEAQEAEILPLFSGYRTPVRISAEQRDLRFHRNCTKKTIDGGEKITTPTEFVDFGNGVLEEVGSRTYHEGKVVKYFCHDSHGKHGRKPRYKDNRVYF